MIVIIPQSETKIIERLGKYHSTLEPGLNFVIPFIDKAKEIVIIKNGMYRTSNSIDLREQVYDFDKQNVITKDNVQTQIDALLYFQIVDAKKSAYEIQNLPKAIEKLTQTTLRNIIGELELDQTLTSRDTINKQLRGILDEATDKWGIKVNRVELQDINPPENILQQMEKQMQAERNKRAAVLTADGEKQALILKSEGDKKAKVNQAEAEKEAAILNAEAQKQAAILSAEAEKQAAILKAEGEAEAKIKKAEAEAIAIERIRATAANDTNPANYLLAQKYISMMEKMANGEGSKTVYLPYEATNVLGSLGGIKELFKEK